MLVRSFRDGLHQLEWKDSVNEMVLVNVSKELHAMAKRLSTPEDPNETDANVLKQIKALLKLKEEDQMAFTHLTRVTDQLFYVTLLYISRRLHSVVQTESLETTHLIFSFLSRTPRAFYRISYPTSQKQPKTREYKLI